MNDKSYVTLEVCPICKEETGTLLLDRRLKETFERHTINPLHPCDKCKSKYLKEGVLLINPNTCSLVVLKESAFRGLFNKSVPPNRICFAEEEVLDKIRKDANGTEKGQ